jgi:F0F1-type ATP synthase epsilon subunit
MATTFRCRIVTPSESVLDHEVKYVSFPAWDGQQGVMPGQSPFLARIGVGSMRVEFAQGASRWYLIDGGFAQMQGHLPAGESNASPGGDQVGSAGGTLTILADRAITAESLVLSDAERDWAEISAAGAARGATGGAKPAAAVPEGEALARRQQFAREKVALARSTSSRGI